MVGFSVAIGTFWPVPVKVMERGLSKVLLVSTRFALRAPSAVGVKVMGIWTCCTPPGSMVIGNVGDMKAKSPGFAPESAIAVMVKGPVPVSATFRVIGVLVLGITTGPKLGPVG